MLLASEKKKHHTTISIYSYCLYAVWLICYTIQWNIEHNSLWLCVWKIVCMKNIGKKNIDTAFTSVKCEKRGLYCEVAHAYTCTSKTYNRNNTSNTIWIPFACCFTNRDIFHTIWNGICLNRFFSRSTGDGRLFLEMERFPNLITLEYGLFAWISNFTRV